MRDLVVVGAGPAGMAAALAASGRGVRVTLVDAGARLGGQIYRQPQWERAGAAAPAAAGPSLPHRFRPLGDGRVETLLGRSVWSTSRSAEGFELRCSRAPGDEVSVLSARAVVLAPGASELVLPFPGWELPGVTTAGGAQALLKAHGLTIGTRIAVAGSGPFLLPVAAALADSGAQVVAVIEAASLRRSAPSLVRAPRHPGKMAEAFGYLGRLAAHRVPVMTGAAVVGCSGQGRVEEARVMRLDARWRPVPGWQRRLDVDAVCISFGFVPRLELGRQLELDDAIQAHHPATGRMHDASMSTSVPGAFVAGELTGIGGAEVAELEGVIAGHAAATYLGRPGTLAGAAEERSARARLARAAAFTRWLEATYSVRDGWTAWPQPRTILCRCEDVTWGAAMRAVADGATSVRAVRNVTRCGMGYCQGRTCGPALALAIAARTGRSLATVGDFHSRSVAWPVPLGEVAREVSVPGPA